MIRRTAPLPLPLWTNTSRAVRRPRASGPGPWAKRRSILVDRGQYPEARAFLTEAIKLDKASANLGPFNYWLGYCAWKLGDSAQAERHLRVARDLLKVQHPLDADAAWTIGRIRQDAGDWDGAMSFYVGVLQNHLDSAFALPARLERGVCRIATGQHDAGLTDLNDVVRMLREKQQPPAKLAEQVLAALRQSEQLLADANNHQGALEMMSLEQSLVPRPTADFFSRIARLYERRADQIQRASADLKGADAAAARDKVRDLRGKAGDAYIAWSRALALKDDAGYGQAMWRGIELYESAGNLPRMIAALETFIGERPSDPLTPDAQLRLGDAFHAAGLFDKAIAAYRECQLRYPRSLPASKAGVPLARASSPKAPIRIARPKRHFAGSSRTTPRSPPMPRSFARPSWNWRTSTSAPPATSWPSRDSRN